MKGVKSREKKTLIQPAPFACAGTPQGKRLKSGTSVGLTVPLVFIMTEIRKLVHKSKSAFAGRA